MPLKDASTPPTVGQIKLYPVDQPAGGSRDQLILIVADPDDNGNVRGIPLGYADEAASLPVDSFAS